MKSYKVQFLLTFLILGFCIPRHALSAQPEQKVEEKIDSIKSKMKRDLGPLKGFKIEKSGKIFYYMSSEVRMAKIIIVSNIDDNYLAFNGKLGPSIDACRPTKAADVVYHYVAEQTLSVKTDEVPAKDIRKSIEWCGGKLIKVPPVFKSTTEQSEFYNDNVVTILSKHEAEVKIRKGSNGEENEDNPRRAAKDKDLTNFLVDFYFMEKISATKNLTSSIEKGINSVNPRLDTFGLKVRSFLKNNKLLKIEKTGDCKADVYALINMNGEINTRPNVTREVKPVNPAHELISLREDPPLDYTGLIVQKPEREKPSVTYFIVYVQPVRVIFEKGEHDNVKKSVDWVIPNNENEESRIRELKVSGEKNMQIDIFGRISAVEYRCETRESVVALPSDKNVYYYKQKPFDPDQTTKNNTGIK